MASKSKNIYVCPMATRETLNLKYSTDFNQLCGKALVLCGKYFICRQGEGRFVYNKSCFHLQRYSLAMITEPDEVSNLSTNNEFTIGIPVKTTAKNCRP